MNVLYASEICKNYGISRPTLWRLIKSGQLPAPVRLVNGPGTLAQWNAADVARAMQARPVTATEAAHKLGVSRMTLHRWAKAGRVPPPPYSPAQVAHMLLTHAARRG